MAALERMNWKGRKSTPLSCILPPGRTVPTQDLVRPRKNRFQSGQRFEAEGQPWVVRHNEQVQGAPSLPLVTPQAEERGLGSKHSWWHRSGASRSVRKEAFVVSATQAVVFCWAANSHTPLFQPLRIPIEMLYLYISSPFCHQGPLFKLLSMQISTSKKCFFFFSP